MKLVAEQIQYLRNRKRELEDKKEEYLRYCQSRETTGLENIGLPHFSDYQEELDNSNKRRELQEIESLLSKSEFVTERNFDVIDVGTAFYVRFGDDEPERTMLVDVGTGYKDVEIYSSLDSDFGKAVLGKKAGDEVTYQVTATGRSVTITIDEIDKIKENYIHFIKEKPFTKRISQPTSRELKRLKEEDPEEYRRRHAITPSQEMLLKEELSKIRRTSIDPSDVSRRGHINKLLRESMIAALPTGEEVRIGSIVEFMLQDGDKEPATYRMEMINRAVSTETDGAYVERISTLGSALYGLKMGSTFQVQRQHLPNLKGIVTAVENYDEKLRRVR